MLLKDLVFYETSHGGVTFSGGEPMQQADFLAEILPHCQRSGLHVALDTCGMAAWEQYEKVLPYVDLVLYDLKIMDPLRHREVTGSSNERILQNVRRIARSGKPLWIRTPIIPGYTDAADNIAAIGRFVQRRTGRRAALGPSRLYEYGLAQVPTPGQGVPVRAYAPAPAQPDGSHPPGGHPLGTRCALVRGYPLNTLDHPPPVIGREYGHRRALSVNPALLP